MADLSTSDVADRLNVKRVTVNVWCLEGLFPNAKRVETPRGPVWSIPESDLTDFEKPTIGRPREKPKPQAKKPKATKTPRKGKHGG